MHQSKGPPEHQPGGLLSSASFRALSPAGLDPKFGEQVVLAQRDAEAARPNTHSARVQIYTALYALGPMAMAYLTLVLNDAASRRTNAVLGAVTAVSGIFGLIGQPAGTDVVVVVAILVALLIVWHAWKWPRGAEAAPSRQSQETARR